jgi:hypothetical protein
MTTIINGSSPSITFSDSTTQTTAFTTTPTINTITSAASTALTLQSAGTTAVTINTSQNVGIGTSSPTEKLTVSGGCLLVTGGLSTLRASSASIDFQSNSARFIGTGADASTYPSLIFGNATTTTYAERMRIGSDGVVMINTTTSGGSTPGQEIIYYNAGTRWGMFINDTTSTNGAYPIGFGSGGNLVGRVQSTSSSVSYETSSDYRLKENIAPMTGALAKVQQLKPVTYTWKIDGTSSQGFIAHELQAVVPECVSGEKDAVNEDNSIKPQGMDTSFLVATLTAAIQELNAKVEAQATTIAELQAKVG